MKTRMPRIAGSWYPDSAEEIMTLIGDGVAAAKKLGLPVVMIDRPKLDYDVIAYTFEEVLAFVKEHIGGK